MSTSVSSVTNHFPSAENGFTTTTSGSVASGATTVGLNSVAGYEDGEVVVFVIDPTDATKKQTFTGVVDAAGVQITGVVWTAGTNQGHDAGATVVDWPSATHVSMISKGLLVQHNQDGTHDTITGTSLNVTDGVTSDTVYERTPANGVTIDGLNIKDSKLTTANSVVTDNYTDGSILPEHLTTGAGTSWVWQSWTPTLSGAFDDAEWTKTCRYTQIGTTVICRIHLVSTTAAPMGGGGGTAIFTLPVTASSTGYVSSETAIGTGTCLNTAVVAYASTIYWRSTTTANIKSIKVDGTNGQNEDVTVTTPFTWGTSDYIIGTFIYEAA